jgi:predicted phage terminase large subunit-like protein
MATSEKKEYKDWLELCKRIKKSTAESRPINEPVTQKKKRIAGLLNDFESFCKYYFPHYCKAPFGWFHKQAAKAITEDKKIFAVLEWPREHAKSVFADVLIPMWLKARGEFKGLILASSNQDKAAGLLADLQAELENNALYTEDFGEQTGVGSWQDHYFIDKDGCGYWAFGRGQSPRGARVAEKRPNLAIADDIDDKLLCKNEARVLETVDWIKEDLLGCLDLEGGRLMVVGNRIHKKSTLAHLVGDIEEGDPINKAIWHSKVWAFERGKKHQKALWHESEAVPAWPERHKAKDLIDRMEKQGTKAALREYFHEHTEEGLVFKSEWIRFEECPKASEMEAIVVYCDPSFKNTKSADYKAICAVGKIKAKYYVLKTWVRQDTVASMVQAFYDMYQEFGNKAAYYMEANMLQDLLLKEFDAAAEERGFHVPLRPDKGKKEDKEMRIENLSPLFQRNHVVFNKAERGTSDMQNLKLQLLGFGNSAVKDDGPDALEGAISKLNKLNRHGQRVFRAGNYIKKSR